MNPANFKARCTAIGFKTNTAIARALQCDRRTIYDWLHGIRPIPHHVDAQLQLLEAASLPHQTRPARKDAR